MSHFQLMTKSHTEDLQTLTQHHLRQLTKLPVATRGTLWINRSPILPLSLPCGLPVYIPSLPSPPLSASLTLSLPPSPNPFPSLPPSLPPSHKFTYLLPPLFVAVSRRLPSPLADLRLPR